MSRDVPESTRRYARETGEKLQYIVRHGSSVEIRACAGALLIRGLPDPEFDRVIAELETGRGAQFCCRLSPRAPRAPNENRCPGRFYRARTYRSA